jgi:hypothetical protein
MIEMIRHCPGCGRDQIFEQHHPQGDECPDSPDGYCTEWFCADCGAALLIGFIPYLRESAVAQLPRRVA